MKEQVEVWKPIKGYEGHYEFSNLHNVKSLSRAIKTRGGGFYLSKERILKQYTTNGYYVVGLCLNGIKINFGIHQLVAMEFLNHIPCRYKLVVDHKNHIRKDNRLENLRIITQRENTYKKHIKCTSNYTGVYWNKSAKKWESRIVINGKKVNLGYFDIETEAFLYYENALNNHLVGLPIEVKKPNFSSKLRGVCFHKSSKKWYTQMTINGKQKFLGYFKTELEAHEKYQNELLKIASNM